MRDPRCVSQAAPGYIFFHGKRHPAELGAPHVSRFLTFLAVDRHVAASPQNQALSALLFLYREVIEVDSPWSLGGAQKLLDEIRQTGLVPATRTGDTRVGVPVRLLTVVVGILLWNAAFALTAPLSSTTDRLTTG